MLKIINFFEFQETQQRKSIQELIKELVNEESRVAAKDELIARQSTEVASELIDSLDALLDKGNGFLFSVVKGPFFRKRQTVHLGKEQRKAVIFQLVDILCKRGEADHRTQDLFHKALTHNNAEICINVAASIQERVHVEDINALVRSLAKYYHLKETKRQEKRVIIDAIERALVFNMAITGINGERGLDTVFEEEKEGIPPATWDTVKASLKRKTVLQITRWLDSLKENDSSVWKKAKDCLIRTDRPVLDILIAEPAKGLTSGSIDIRGRAIEVLFARIKKEKPNDEVAYS